MKKVLVVLLSILILCACNSVEAGEESRFTGVDSRLEIATDNQTGCKYIILSSYQYGGGVTPLLTSDGTPDCGK